MNAAEQFLRDHSARPEDAFLTRRQWLNRFGMGFGTLGLATLLGENFAAQSASAAPGGSLNPLAPRDPHFTAKAKHVVHIFAQGAPSQVDTWDPKPALTKHDGQKMPGAGGVAFGSPFKFTKQGQSGIEASEVFPQLAKHVDELAVIRSMHTDIPAHEVATVFINTGSLRLSKPSLGAWALYGLGTINQNMPGFIALRPGNNPSGGTQNWQSAFLPGIFQGTSINTKNPNVEEMIENIRNRYFDQKEQRRQLDLVHQLNAIHSQNLQKDAQLEARIEAFEMAYKMQMAATDAFDITKEPDAMRQLYGTSAQGNQMLIARRLIERGVRFVQVWAGGWDHHNNLETRLAGSAREIDQPAAAFLTDLKQRGLLDQTLVLWGGEFGRKPSRDRNGNDNAGRDHNNRGFCAWMAGGGIKGGTLHGATDEFGGTAVKDKMHIHDLHATILQLLGFNHEKLTFRYNGRDFRLTDNFGKVARNIIA